MSADLAPNLFTAALQVSLPTFGWVLMGLVLSRLGLLPQRVIDVVSRFAFNFILPLMLLVGAAQVDYSQLGDARYLLAGVLGGTAVAGLTLARTALARSGRSGSLLF